MNVQLTSGQIKLLAVHIVRDIETLRAVTGRVKTKLWGLGEVFELACWKVAEQGFRESGGLMPKEIFEVQVRACLEREHPGHGMTEENIANSIEGLFCWPVASLSFSLVRPILEEFLVSREVAEKLSSLMLGNADYITVINEMGQVVQGAKMSAVQPEDLNDPAYDDIFVSMQRQMTGCLPFDEMIGGIYSGHTIGLLGPMKGGKTSLLQSVVSDFVKKAGGNQATYITYEETTKQLLPKLIISFMNRHHRDKLIGKAREQIEPSIFAESQTARKFLAERVSLIDMSGARDGQGRGGPAELVSTIESLHRSNRLGQLVVVDHVLLMVQSYLNATGADLTSMLRHAVADVCTQFKEVCARLGITGILAHQMAAKGNTSAKHVPSHLDAAECKLFSQVLHDCLCLGKKTDDGKDLAWLHLSASRNSAPKKMWVHVAGYKCRVQMPKKEMTTDSSGKPITKEEAVHGRLGVNEAGEPVRPKTFHVDSETPAAPGADVFGSSVED